MTLTATYDPQLSRVRLSADTLGGANRVRFERSPNGVTWQLVRGGAAVAITGGAASLDDYEFAADQQNRYRVLPTLVEDFEDTVDDLGYTGAWLRTQADAAGGAWSLTNNDVGDGVVTDADVTVPAGATSIEFDWRVSSEAGFDFFGFLIDGVQALADSGELPWAHATFDISAATTVTFRYAKDGLASVGDDAAYVDNVVFSGFPIQSSTVTPTLAGVWLKSIARPFLNRTVTVTDWSEVSRRSRNGVFDVVGRSVPVAVTDLRSGREYELTVMESTPAAADELDTVLASGDPVLVHVPPDCLVPRSMYAVVGDVAVSRASARGLRRYFRLPLTEVAPPGPDVVGATVTCQTVLNAYATCADVLAAHPTCLDLLELIGDPTDVIVP